MRTALHVLPRGDSVEHATTDDCPCGPATEPVHLADGSVSWVVVHASIDGRELRERGQTIPSEVA